LVLGIYEGPEIVYVGHVGTGFDEHTLEFLHGKMKSLKVSNPPLAKTQQTNSPITWIQPQLVCEVKFAEWTQEGLMRQAVFLGLREDKAPQDIRREAYHG